MWIEGWSVDAFGHLRHTGTDGLTDGLNVVLGANESGKTTTLHFLRWVLFGFPSAKSNVFRHYKPGSGDFGGRVRVGHGNRLIGVERHHGDDAPTLTSADGSALTELSWTHVVGSAGPELFESVFAITTSELRGIEELDTNEVREQIYAAGTVGRGRSARSVLEQLDKANAVLLSQRKGRIRELHDDLARCSEELGGAVERSKGLDRRREEVRALLDEVRDHEQQRQELDAAGVHLRKLMDSWQSWVEATAAERELDAMPEPVDLPPEPTAVLTAATGELERLDGERRAAEETLNATLLAIEDIHVDDHLAELAARVRQLEKMAPAMADRDKQLSAQRSELARAREDVTQSLSTLGAGWTPQATAGIDVSPLGIQEAGAHAESLASARARWSNAHQELETIRKSHHDTGSSMADAQARLSEARSQLAGVGDTTSARAAVLDLQGLVPRLEAAEARAAEADNYRLLTRHLESAAPSAFVPPIVLPILIVVAVLCVVGAGVSFATDSPVGGVALLIVTVGLVVLADVVRTATRIPDEAPGTQRATDGTTDGTDEEAQRQELVAAVDSAARVAGFAHRPTPQALNDRIVALDRLRDIEEEVRSLEAALGQCSVDLDTATEAERSARDALSDASARWQSWRNGHGLPEGVEPDRAVAFLELVRITRESLRTEERLTAEVGETHSELESWRAGVREVLEGTGFDPGGGPVELTRCLDAVELDERRRAERERLRSTLPAMRERLATAEEEHRCADQRVGDLLARARATTSEEYLVAVETEARRRELHQRLEELEVELAGRFGNDEAVRSARRELATGDIGEWEQRLRETEAQLADTRARHDEAVRNHQDAMREVEQLERSADVAELSLAQESLRSELRDAIEEWTVTTLAHRGIDSTLRRFETERQPEVVRIAAESFGRITHGRYTGIVPEDGTLRVVMADGAGLDASKLSGGTTEQLYLAMRFGLARHYARSTPLPLVLDDVLVNADPSRRRALAEELLVVARDLQVILFTCHPGTAEVLAEVAGSHGAAGSDGAGEPHGAAGSDGAAGPHDAAGPRRTTAGANVVQLPDEPF